MRYRLLALDLDGTLLDPAGHISEANRDAIAAAQDAGCLVVPCTGRGWRETRYALRAHGESFQGLSVGVFVNGACVCRLDDGTPEHRRDFDPELALALIDTLADCPDAVLVHRDFHAVGHEYLVTGRGRLTDNTAWWFQVTEARVHEDRAPTAADLDATLRVGLVTDGEHARRYEALVRERFDGRVDAHEMVAIQSDDPAREVRVFEAFPAGVSKWTGVRRLADAHGILPPQIAVIGDEVNDLPMIHGCREANGCAVAMANATPAVRAAANRLTTTNRDDGVAHAIRQMLDDAW